MIEVTYRPAMGFLVREDGHTYPASDGEINRRFSTEFAKAVREISPHWTEFAHDERADVAATLVGLRAITSRVRQLNPAVWANLPDQPAA